MKTRTVLDTLHEYVPGKRIEGAVKLSSNENPLGPSRVALDAARAALEGVHIYPDGSYPDLRRAVAAKLGLEATQVLPTNGSDEALTLIAATYLEPDAPVIVPAHTFSQYEFAARLFDARIVAAPMPALAIDLDIVANLIDNETRIIFLCSPNNPTGLALRQDELRAFLDRVPDHVLVVIDHAYIDYVESPGQANAIELIPAQPNLVVLRTFSKLYGLAAMRVGYALAQPQRIAEIQKTRSPFNVNAPAAAAAVASLGDDAFAAESLAVNRSGKQRMEAIYDRLGLHYLPTEANFHAVRVPGGDAAAAAAHIARGGVTVRALGSFGLPEWLRISVGTDRQIDHLEPLLAEICRRSG